MVSFNLCDGNPGALTFMMDAYDKFLFKAEAAFQRMQDNLIRGAKLYMLWNDCCDRNTKKAVEIMLNNPIDDILQHINYEQGRGIPYEDEATENVDRYPGETEDILKKIKEAGE